MRHIIYITKSVPNLFLARRECKNSKENVTNIEKCDNMAEIYNLGDTTTIILTKNSTFVKNTQTQYDRQNKSTMEQSCQPRQRQEHRQQP